jgi:hypothetical protein
MPAVNAVVTIYLHDNTWMQDGQYLLIGNEVESVFVGGLFRVVNVIDLGITATLVAYDQNADEEDVIPVNSRVVIGGRPDQSDLALVYAAEALASKNAAEAAETAAGLSASAASASAIAAAASEAGVAASALTATNAASTATTKANEADESADAAAIARGEAEDARDAAAASAASIVGDEAAAAASAAAAAISAAAALTSQNAAEVSADAAEASAETAQVADASANGHADTASAAAGAAALSESAAYNSELAAAASAGSASTSASTATAQAAVATTQALLAQTAATNAEAARAAAVAALLNLYAGTSAGNAVPATLTAAGYYLRITSAGTSQSITWAVGDIAIYSGVSGSYTKIAMDTYGFALEAEVNPRLAARAPLSGVQVTATGSVIGTIPNGAAQFGLGDFGLRAQVLRSATATANALARSHSSGNNRVELRTTTGNALILRFVDGSGSNTDYTFPTYTLPLNTPAALHVVADRDGNAVLYDHGVSVSTISIAASAAVNIGSGNTGVADVVGAFFGTIQRVEWLNVALTAAEVALLHAFGWAALPRYVHEGGAGRSLFAAAAINGSTAYDTFTGASTTGFTAAVTSPSTARRSGGWNVAGIEARKDYRLLWGLAVNSGALGSASAIRLQGASNNITQQAADLTMAAGASQSAVIVPFASGNFFLSFGNSDPSGTVAVDFTVSSASMEPIGLCGSWTFDGTGAGYQERDRSGGRRPLLLTTTGVSRLQRGDRIQVTATEAHAGSGNRQLTGQAVLPDVGWRLVAATAKADANVTIQVGAAPGGATVVGSVALTSGTLTALTVAELKPTTVNAWSNASTAANITYSLVYERDDIV